MGKTTRAAITIANGVTYINDANTALAYLQRLGDGVEGPNGCSLVAPFIKKVKAIAGEVGSQIAVSAATGVACSSGGVASRVARAQIGPKRAKLCRKEARQVGMAKHDMEEVACSSGDTAPNSDGNDSDPSQGETLSVKSAAVGNNFKTIEQRFETLERCIASL